MKDSTGQEIVVGDKVSIAVPSNTFGDFFTRPGVVLLVANEATPQYITVRHTDDCYPSTWNAYISEYITIEKEKKQRQKNRQTIYKNLNARFDLLDL